jgi:hypothetical protein
MSVANWTNTKRAPEWSPVCLSQLAAADFLDHDATAETLFHDDRAAAADHHAHAAHAMTASEDDISVAAHAAAEGAISADPNIDIDAATPIAPHAVAAAAFAAAYAGPPGTGAALHCRRTAAAAAGIRTCSCAPAACTPRCFRRRATAALSAAASTTAAYAATTPSTAATTTGATATSATAAGLGDLQ